MTFITSPENLEAINKENKEMIEKQRKNICKQGTNKEEVKKEIFEYEYLEFDKLREKIRECEGRHTQQVVWSTFHDCLTQIDWTDKMIRSNKRI